MDKLMAGVSDAFKDSAKELEDIFKDDEELRKLLAHGLRELQQDIEAGIPLSEIADSRDAEATLLLSAAASRLGEKQAKMANTMQEFLTGMASILIKQLIPLA
jgi:hypothetical protein